MAPRKRKAGEGGGGAREDGEQKTAPLGKRVTRSMTRGASYSSNSAKPENEAPKKKKKEQKKKKKKEEKEVEGTKEEEEEDGPTKKGRIIIVEHCKQCNSFKTRATMVKDGLEKSVPGVTVILNPDKPRRGCFEIREEGGEKFISLLDMKRPFQPMKALDMEEVILDIVDKIQG